MSTIARTVAGGSTAAVSVKSYGAPGNGTTNDTAAIQAAATTQPTVRIVSTGYTPVLPISPGTSAPSASTALGYLQTSVTAAPPSTFSTTLSVSGNVPRVFVRAA